MPKLRATSCSGKPGICKDESVKAKREERPDEQAREHLFQLTWRSGLLSHLQGLRKGYTTVSSTVPDSLDFIRAHVK